MKIGIFTNNYLPNPYGVSGSIESFRLELERLGHQIYIFAPKFKGYEDDNKNVFRYPAINVKFKKVRYPLPIPYSRKISRIIKKLDLDIIHSQHPNLLGTEARKWARRKKVPLVFTWHTLYDQYAHFVKIIPSGWAGKYMIKKAVDYANSSDIVIAPTASIISSLRRWGVKKKIVPIETGVCASVFENAERENTRLKLGIKEDEILLLIVSRLTEEKNISFLFRSVAKVLARDKKVKFLVAAGGHLQGEMEKLIKKNDLEHQVIFTGAVDNTVKKDYYAAGDIFVFSSKSETQGMVLSEAMYMGLPIVALDASGAKSLVINNGNGFLVREDEDEFSKAVWKLVEDNNLRLKFSENSQKIARTQFTSLICAQKMLRMYQSLL